MNSNTRDDLYLFTDCDLDGAGCYFLLRKVLNDAEIPHTVSTEKKFRNSFLSLPNKENYKKIYICDLSVLCNNLDIIDMPNVVYMNHRNTDSYKCIEHKQLHQESQDFSSCTLLMYDRLKAKINLTQEQKRLLSLIDDYDSYKLQFPESKKLHFLISSFTDNKLTKFYSLFKDGFNGFTETQHKIISIIEKQIETTFDKLKIFKGNIKIGGTDTTICSTFNNIFPSEICDKIIKKYNCDIAINVNLNTSSVSIRKSKLCFTHLGKFAQKIFDGGGDSSVAGGKITKTFLELSKQLYPIT